MVETAGREGSRAGSSGRGCTWVNPADLLQIATCTRPRANY